MENSTIDAVSEHLMRYEAICRMADVENADPEDLILLISDVNASFRRTLDHLTTPQP